ncbi:MAG TPA: hypothetical protein VJB15_05550 [Rhodothermia bacterium]|nr:hypothetical protein [Rhodothermia bacterium]
MFRWHYAILMGALLSIFAVRGVAAQASANGQLYSALYVSEDSTGTQLWDSYHGVRFNAAPLADRSVRVKGDFRVARRGDPEDWSERVYSLYADWAAPSRNVDVRVGRQFLYRGVLNGSVDGGMVTVRPAPKVDVGIVAGMAVPIDRSLDVTSWEDGGTIGAFSSYRFTPDSRVDLSYVQRLSNDEIAWRQLGASVAGAFSGDFYYNGQLDYNLEKEEVQTGRLRLMYIVTQWTLSAEFNRQLPRIFEDSYFNIFEIEAFNQLRGGLHYRFGRYGAGAQYLHTMYEEDESADAVLLSFDSPWGTIGTALQSGYGGDRTGVFGEIRYDVLPELTLMARSSYYSYERRTVSIEEDATAVSGGLRYRPIRPLVLQGEIQQSANSYLDSDVRALLRVQYAFDLSSPR